MQLVLLKNEGGIEGLRIEHRKSNVSDFVTVSIGVASILPTSGVDRKKYF